MYWNILVWLRIEIPDGFLHQISENLKIDDLVTGGTINLQLTHKYSPILSVTIKVLLPSSQHADSIRFCGLLSQVPR